MVSLSPSGHRTPDRSGARSFAEPPASAVPRSFHSGLPLKILLVADDSHLLQGTATALARDGLTILTARTGQEALQRWQADQPDVVVLDVDLAGRSGLDVCRQIRASGPTPVILLSAQTTDEQVVEGFRAGADDYLGKPVRPRELALRIRAVARRLAEAQARQSQQEVQEVRVASLGLVVDLEAHEVRRDNHLIQLTSLQFRLLCPLATNAGMVVPTERLIRAAWGSDGGDTVSLKSHLSQLRKKLHLPRQGPGSLSAVTGVGYRLER